MTSDCQRVFEFLGLIPIVILRHRRDFHPLFISGVQLPNAGEGGRG
jgi:hypothetical protein